MATHTPPSEMRKMQLSDLRSEVSDLRASIAKMRMGLSLRSEKDSAEFRRQRKTLARMLTVMAEKEMSEPSKTPATKKTGLNPRAKRSRVPAPAK